MMSWPKKMSGNSLTQISMASTNSPNSFSSPTCRGAMRSTMRSNSSLRQRGEFDHDTDREV